MVMKCLTGILLDLQIVTEDVVVKNDRWVGKHLSALNLTESGCFLNRITRSQIEMPIERDILLNKGDVLRISGEKRRVTEQADRIGFISVHSRITDLVSFSTFFVIGLMIGHINVVFGSFDFTVGNATGLLASGIMMGYLRAVHPTVGHVPQAALQLLKDLGLLVFMIGIGLSAGKGILEYLTQVGPVIIVSGLLVSTVPVVLSYFLWPSCLKNESGSINWCTDGCPNLCARNGNRKRNGTKHCAIIGICWHLCVGKCFVYYCGVH